MSDFLAWLHGYEGPKHGRGDEDYVSRDWCGGVRRGMARWPEMPRPTSYSRQVARRILEGRRPTRQLVRVLGFPGKAVAQ